MNFFNAAANLHPEFRAIGETPAMSIAGLSRIHKAHFIAALAEEPKLLPLLVLVETESEAMRLCEDITAFGFSKNFAAVYPAKDRDFTAADTKSLEYEQRRLAVLARLSAESSLSTVNCQLSIVAATPESAAQMTLSPQELADSVVHIAAGDEINTDALLAGLVERGYTRVDLAESAAQFSVRGSVIDVFPVNSPAPVRIDLWGDTVDSLALFDTESQRRVDKIERVEIAPAVEPVGKSTIFDFVRRIIVCEQTNCNEQFRAAYEQMKADIELALESAAGRLPPPTGEYMLGKSAYEAAVSDKLIAKFDTFSRDSSALSVNALQLPPWNGDYRQLKDDLSELSKCGYALVVFAGTEKSAKSLAQDLRDDGFKADYSESPKKLFARHIFVTAGTLSAGFDYPAVKCACLTAAGRGERGGGHGFAGGTPQPVKKPKRKNKSETIRMITDINVGDYVVHDNYGIGIFEGVTKLTADGASKDYIKLKYAGKDVLYVPVTQLDFIARYIGNTDSVNLKLSRLNTDSWFKAKAKVRKAVEELAEELIELYSKRMKTAGYAFPADCREQTAFENAFGYVETNDQLTCIEELKADMQSERPMDRLLCGDVGFGKTEVALRGVFKCVMGGKQCALLCPTTVLAWQHYQTALQRFSFNSGQTPLGGLTSAARGKAPRLGNESEFPGINIELLSRFRSAKEQREILAKLKSGVIDFVIGTHTLVGKEVEFCNLGLVIIDEEQRFGVTQKERLKGLRSADLPSDKPEVFAGVDVLTLSATPIPRTLNMAMSGIRDMSVIETPPHDRIPVTTYVIEQDMGVIVQAINKELRRAGQVYYIHNRVETIVSCAAKLHELIPEARIGIAHGRMDERGLLNVWRQLLEREIDVLVCTTLIETGVDVPNVNTLIIENADHMGLAQLHQLRGRVGRTNRRAYAYFCFARGKVLSEIAEKRLKAVREFTQFGAGFKIALRDLEIRGAGSVLGESQSGHLSSVGYETYVRLLEEAVGQLTMDNGQLTIDNPPKLVQCTVDIKCDAFIPESYISNQAQRIACYKKIAEIRDEDDARDVVDELTDRYGALPKSARGLVEAARLRNMASCLGISEVAHAKETLTLYWEQPDMQRLAQVPQRFARRVELNMVGRVSVSVKLGKLMWNEKGKWHESPAIDDVLGAALEFLEQLTIGS
jgi:transcription-repair coupling factor (superfamily II helicase)